MGNNDSTMPPEPGQDRFIDGPGMRRALTFDERRSLAVATRKSKIGGPNMRRAMTFVGKKKFAQIEQLKLDDVMFRKHFDTTIGPQVAIPIVNISEPEFVETSIAKSDVKDEAVVVVDTFSTGAMVAYLSYLKGYKVICVLSGNLENLLGMVPEGLNFSFHAVMSLNSEMNHSAAFANLVGELQSLGMPIKAVIAGAETGVELADELSSYLNLRTNGTGQSEARRNKYVMGETVRAAGLRAVRQLKSDNWPAIEAYLNDWQPDPFKVIVKPMDSAGSDDVTLCTSIAEVQAAFGNIMGKINGLGLINKAVLVQEYLEGPEFVVDMVSRDGEHKVVTIWEYDRRAANDAKFVVYGQRLRILSEDERYGKIVDYQKKVVTALGIRNGPSHGEVKWFQGEPCLVEVGSRCHGSDGLWVLPAQEATRFNQAQATCDLYLDSPDAFDAIPSLPVSREKYAAIKFIVSYQDGVVESMNEEIVNEITSMSSYRGHQWFVKVGGPIVKSRNCFTVSGCVQLVNADEATFERDYARIEALQTSLFHVKEKEVTPPAQAAVVVDPFSTGACLAAELFQRGYVVIAVYSAEIEKLGNLQNLVPEGLTLTFEAIIGFDPDISVMVAAIRAATKGAVQAVFAGAETGVELADALSSAMNLRTNGTGQSEARRNKYVMGETVRAAGLRAVRQLKSDNWPAIEAYLNDWQPDPFKVIVKPMDSAGSEGVTLCTSMAECAAAFQNLYGKKNGLGLINKSVLVQEFLEGTEYVVDIVSKDGVPKVTCIWEYDRRPINGAGFVVFGQRLRTIPENPEKYGALVEYQKRVIAALGIQQGPSHGEVKWFKGEPVLVEVGARCHGAEGAWIPVADAVLKCNQPSVTIDAYMAPEKFSALRDLPIEKYTNGMLAFLICHVRGTLIEISANFIEEIRSLQSFVRMELFHKLGMEITPTINYFNFGGVTVLINSDNDQLERDYARVHEIEEQLFIVK